MEKKPIVAILMGSKSDLSLMRPACEILEAFEVEYELRVLSAHRTPERTSDFATKARKRGIQVVICAAGGAAHLAGVVAGLTTLPVIGVPLARTPLAGQDALLATVQMPTGIPVATVAVDGAANAAILAAQILGLNNPAVEKMVENMRAANLAKVIADDEELNGGS
ncbi:MAG: 5-(carboxyamino)imidazole ribonucleotide mutase [Kofleriaceae bacterium]|nr:5-(carboxyamino)imidazole ribonucleotide mutase [Kofleriaceae bacterium]